MIHKVRRHVSGSSCDRIAEIARNAFAPTVVANTAGVLNMKDRAGRPARRALPPKEDDFNHSAIYLSTQETDNLENLQCVHYG